MKISVCLNTWRLGALDPVVTSLEQQDFPRADVELLIADELHRWRAPVLHDRLARCSFSVRHLPVERSLFPVCSTMRASNTTLRAARGALIVHVCDGAVLPPSFLFAHWRNYLEDPKSIGIYPYRGRTLRPDAWTMPALDAWGMVEWGVRQGAFFPDQAWTGFRDRALRVSSPLDVDALCEPLDPAHPQGGSPALDVEPGQYANEWFAHYKTDSVPREAYLAVNGWDEEYDGGYIYADIDMTLRLMALGYRTRVVDGPEVPILDLHPFTIRSAAVAFRQHLMMARLEETKRRLAELWDTRCAEGLVRVEHVLSDSPSWVAQNWPLSRKAFQGKEIQMTITRPWLASGRLDLSIPAPYAFAWQYVVPPVSIVNDDGHDWGGFDRVLGADACVSTIDLVKPTVSIVLIRDDAPVQNIRRVVEDAEQRAIIIGNKATIETAEAVCIEAAVPCLVHEADAAMPVNAVIAFTDRKQACAS